MTAYEIYLGQAKDIYDLEHRENAWKKRKKTMNIFKRIGGFFMNEDAIRYRTSIAMARAGITKERLAEINKERKEDV